jgi:membrane fusion protein, multidrug efflux system
MQKKQWISGAICALVVAAIAGGALALQQSREREAQLKKDAAANVTLEFAAAEVVTPQLTTLPVSIEFAGPLVAPGTAVVRAKASGTLLSLAVAEGSRVRAGQTLGTLDLAELSSRVAERGASVESARAQLNQAERQHAANQRLAEQNFISGTALEASSAALEAARAQFMQSQTQLGTSRISLRDAELIAPIAGVIAKRHALPGEKLSPEQNVLTIVDLARLELAGNVGTHEVSLLRPGMAVEVQVEGVAAPVSGKLERIAPAAEAGTRAIGVIIAISNPREAFRAGQYALARVQLRDETQRLTLPVSAIAQASGQDHVWLIESGVLVRRAVTTGRRDTAQGRVEVLSGLTPNAQVLTARFDNLREGGKASVASSGGAAVASTPATTKQR